MATWDPSRPPTAPLSSLVLLSWTSRCGQWCWRAKVFSLYFLVHRPWALYSGSGYGHSRD